MKPTPAQQMMIADGLPESIVLMTQAERNASWLKNPPKPYAPFTDPRLEQTRQLLAEQKRISTQARIDILRTKKGLPPIYNQTKTTQTQEEDMPKLVIKPLDQHGSPVIRGMTSIKDDADYDGILAQVQHAVKRGGKKIATVLLIGTEGQPVKAWSVTRDLDGNNPELEVIDPAPFNTQPIAQAETAPAEAANEAEADSEESDMAAKKSKAKTARKPKVAGEVRKGSKTEIVAKLLKRDTGCTAKQVLEATGWPSVSMPAIAKACGLKLRKEKVKGEGPTRYFGS